MALLGALCVGLNTLGFTNRSLRAQVSRDDEAIDERLLGHGHESS